MYQHYEYNLISNRYVQNYNKFQIFFYSSPNNKSQMPPMIVINALFYFNNKIIIYENRNR